MIAAKRIQGHIQVSSVHCGDCLTAKETISCISSLEEGENTVCHCSLYVEFF